jgi:hypothetical protein
MEWNGTAIKAIVTADSLEISKTGFENVKTTNENGGAVYCVQGDLKKYIFVKVLSRIVNVVPKEMAQRYISFY